jgi:hypothetical protein
MEYLLSDHRDPRPGGLDLKLGQDLLQSLCLIHNDYEERRAAVLRSPVCRRRSYTFAVRKTDDPLTVQL